MAAPFVLQHALPTSSRLVFGCMGLGGSWDASPITAQHVQEAQAAVEAALEFGITLFDHADIYTLGKAEQVFGTLLRQQPGLRERILLQSKCSIRFPDDHGPQRYDQSRDYLLTSVDGILSRLGVEYLDVLLLHRPDPLMEPDEVAEAWLQLKQSGKVRHLGVSNMHSGQMALLQRSLPDPLRVNQLEMSLLRHDWVDHGTCFNDEQSRGLRSWGDTLDYCRLHDVQVQAWSPLAQGWFSGALPADAPPAVQQTARLVSELAAKHQTSAESIVLAWLLRHPAGIQPVIGTRHPDRVRACGDATRISLSREEWYQLYLTVRGRRLP